MQPLTVLSIAGSDSGGGAGIQADLRTFSAFALHVTNAVTAVTAQNTVGVDSVLPIDPDMVSAQVLSVTTDFDGLVDFRETSVAKTLAKMVQGG